MALVSLTGLILLFGIVAAYLIRKVANPKKYSHPLPPGPKGLPLLGNVNDLPKPGSGLEAHHWLKHKDLYGPISSVTVLGQTIVIINDAQIALELLRDRAQHQARPHMVFASDMCVQDTSASTHYDANVLVGLVGRTHLLSAASQTISRFTARTLLVWLAVTRLSNCLIEPRKKSPFISSLTFWILQRICSTTSRRKLELSFSRSHMDTMWSKRAKTTWSTWRERRCTSSLMRR